MCHALKREVNLNTSFNSNFRWNIILLSLTLPHKLLKRLISVESSSVNHCLLIASVHSLFNNKRSTINECVCSTLGIISASRARKKLYTAKPVVLMILYHAFSLRFGLACISLECTCFQELQNEIISCQTIN